MSAEGAARTCRVTPVAYAENVADLFSALRDMPGAILFDSARPLSPVGRYDILAANPDRERSLTLDASAGAGAVRGFFADLARLHAESAGGAALTGNHRLPFAGGFMGYLTYETGAALMQVPAHPADAATIPDARASYYPWAVVQDHQLRQSWLISQHSVGNAERREVQERLRAARPGRTTFTLRSEFRSNLPRKEYAAAYRRIIDYIHAGDCYQVNLAQRLQASYSGDPFAAYEQLRRAAAAPYSGYVQTGEHSALLCLSPEQFISLSGGRARTSPIKGTRPRSADPAIDRAAAAELLNSDKDRAENLMIVDLLRNDLGRNCLPGSIRVDELFTLHSFPNVHHLVSSISGDLRPERSAVDLLRDCFPGGSITGAPKKRAMEIIAELEPHRRQAYCGSMFYLSACGTMDSNITIRSLLASDGSIRCWAGGGIVADSQCEAEHQETLDKVSAYLQCLSKLSE